MDWLKKRRLQAYDKEQKLVRDRMRGEILLEELIKCCDGKSNPIKFFTYDEIRKAMGNICKCNIPQKSTNTCQCARASGLSGHVTWWYSGMLDNHRMILVNMLVYGIPNPRKFCRDIAISSMVSGHKNFMKLVGCCLEFTYPVMVYYGAQKQYSCVDLKVIVSWKRRMKIAEDVATALAYLHTAFPRPLIYLNMELRNILLDGDAGVAKLNDFSHCISIPQGETFVKLSNSTGTYGYMDDDYMINHVVSEKSDAFGFGRLMQTLLTGEEIFDERSHWNDWDKFPNWLSKSIGEGRVNEVVDPKMLEEMGEVSEEERCRMEAFIVLSERCIGRRGEVPKMVQVAKKLKKIIKDDA